MSWNSGGRLEHCWNLGVLRFVCVSSRGVGETTISRHWGPFASVLFAVAGERVWGPVGVWMVLRVESDGAMD